MLKDFFVTLTKRTVTKVTDGAGSFSETYSDTEIAGYIALLSSYKIAMNQLVRSNVIAQLFTNETLTIGTIIIYNGIEYEVVGVYTGFIPDNTYKYYDLKSYGV